MSLAERMSEYIKSTGKKVAEIAKELGYSRTALSSYINGTYRSNPANIERKITDYLAGVNKPAESEPIKAKLPKTEPASDGTAADIPKSIKQIETNTFYKSNDALNIMATAKACQDEFGLGCIIGASGYGKTITLKKYAATLEKTVYIECNSLMSRRDLLTRIEKGLGLPVGRGTSDDRTNAVVNFLTKNRGYLIIVDEADKLITKDTIEKLEVLRTIYDLSVEDFDSEQHTVGILIAGEPRLKNNILSWNERYAKRIEQYYELKGLKRDEVLRYLDGLDITQKAVDELLYRATNERNGCFRLLNRTLKNIKRVLGNRNKITAEIIMEASSMMMI